MTWPYDPTAYVLGELSPADQRGARGLELEDSGFADAVAAARRVAGLLGALDTDGARGGAEPTSAEPASAPAARTRLSAPDPARGPRRHALALTAAAIILLLVGGAGGALLGGADRAPAGPVGGESVPADAAGTDLRSTTFAPRGAHGRARVVTGPRGRVELDVAGLAPSAPHHFYELWMRGSGQRMVSVGAFRVGDDGAARVRFPLAVDPRLFPIMDVSDQAADRGPGHSRVTVLRSSQTG